MPFSSRSQRKTARAYISQTRCRQEHVTHFPQNPQSRICKCISECDTLSEVEMGRCSWASWIIVTANATIEESLARGNTRNPTPEYTHAYANNGTQLFVHCACLIDVSSSKAPVNYSYYFICTHLIEKIMLNENVCLWPPFILYANDLKDVTFDTFCNHNVHDIL